MRQNTSSAVMQQRAEPHDSLDDFPTPPWAGRALMEHVIGPVWGFTAGHRLWEPAVNRGFLLRGLADYFGPARISDVHDYGLPGTQQEDFLWPTGHHDTDWIITNPPFRLAHAFIDKSLSEARMGCAFLVRTSFLEGVNRYQSLFSRRPPTFVAQFAERVPMVKGRCDAEASTATSYCWPRLAAARFEGSPHDVDSALPGGFGAAGRLPAAGGLRVMFHANSKASEIVRLFEEGLSQREIGRRLGCSQANVCLAIKRHVGSTTISVKLSDRRHAEWLLREARRCGVDKEIMARALLTDAICEAMEAESKR